MNDTIRKLGKQDHKYDKRTLKLGTFLLPEIRVPAQYDFDKNKRPIPIPDWGNLTWGNCVVAGEANHLLRMERIEQRRTVPLSEEAVVRRYKALSGAQKPGDDHDTGLIVLEAMRQWRKGGWNVGSKNYKIAAYGELEPGDGKQLRMAAYVLHGIHFGFSLPNAAQRMGKIWDYNGETGQEWRPGSWGGHLVYGKAFNPGGFEILSWGLKVFVRNSFIEHYCDEAWAVVDSLDSWRVKQTVNVTKLLGQLGQITDKLNP